MNKNILVIGLTGSFGSGCTESSKYLRTEEFERFCLSDIIRNEAERRNLKSPNRKNMQNIGDRLRKKNGNGHLMVETLKKVNKSSTFFVIDSIRNEDEVYELRRVCPNSYLIAVDAGKDIRYERVKDKYPSREAFEKDDERDSGEDQPEYGQQVKKCVNLADVIIKNDTTSQDLENKLVKYVRLMKNPQHYQPSKDERGMAYAFRESRRSQCLKRQVGATIMIKGFVVAKGYNDVPTGVVPCRDMGQCERDYRREQSCSKCKELIVPRFDKCSKCKTPIPKDLREMMRKHLDLCRALHAEERAILRSVKHLKDSPRGITLYVTTHPCLLCAKKIIEMGVRKVVYVDPYPHEAAARMLIQAHVKVDKFEGVMERALDRLFVKQR